MAYLKFPENLRNALAVNGLVQQNLSNLLGTTQQTISRWLNGITEPDLSTLIEICLYLGETPDSLLGFDDIPPQVHEQYKAITKKERPDKT